MERGWAGDGEAAVIGMEVGVGDTTQKESAGERGQAQIRALGTTVKG